MKHSAMITAIALATLSAPGCFLATSRKDGDEMHRRITTLETRLAAKDKAIDAQVEALKVLMADATRLLRRNGADLGADLLAVRADLRAVRGLITSTQTSSEHALVGLGARVDAIEARLAAVEQKASAPDSPEELWNLGRAAYGIKRYDEGRGFFLRLATEYPSHDRADDARYLLGESHRMEGQWESAIREYQKVFDQHGGSPLADDALFQAGVAAEQLQLCTEARAYFGLLSQRYPRSELASEAIRRTRTLKANLRNRSKCKS